MRAILTYHSVDDSGSVISVTPARFAEHVRWFATSRVRVVSVADLLAAGDEEHAVAITFDDALASFASHAWPMLRESALPATVFVPSGFVGGWNRWAALPGAATPPLRLLDWEQIARLAEEGVHIGAHSRTHPDLRSVGNAQLDDEIEGCRQDIERETGTSPSGFAYPYGFVDHRIADRTRRSFQWACTTVLRPLSASEDVCRLPRLDSYYFTGAGSLQFFGSRAFRSYVFLRAAMRRWRASLT